MTTSQPSKPSLPLILLLHNVRSLHNVGSVFRSADGAGVSRIILSGLTATPPRPEILKTALGATETVPWEYCRDPLPRLALLKQQGYCVYALEQTPQAQSLYGPDITLPAVLIVGHEREGVEPRILAACDGHLEIPMHGSSAHSLNVSNATAVALYEIRRQFCYDNRNKG